MDIEQSTLEKCLMWVLIFAVLYLLFFRRKNKNRKYKEYYHSPNIMDHHVNVSCEGDNELGFIIEGEESLDTQSTKSSVSSKSIQNIIRDEKDLCVVDAMEDEVYKFATQEKCDCNKKNGCTVCELKHSNDHDITRKLCQERNKNFSCLVDRMESDNVDYMKGLMLGTNIN